eukprot:TRINITY_DN3283_c0_g1_i3.p1 TRINITY_DN3283_c0_g1~~TRINITY_DN3283_c0_g1_i3.p1  ORF type:complete len:140 (+),score=35.98 TRINITY_DN3283_c0_g1_i3:144-563(+)
MIEDQGDCFQKIKPLVRVMNFTIGIALIALAVLGFFAATLQPLLFLSGLYLGLFGVMILSSEIELKFIEDYFNFLKTLLGRGIFYIYLGSMCAPETLYGLANPITWFQLILSICFYFSGLVYLIAYGINRRSSSKKGLY